MRNIQEHRQNITNRMWWREKKTEYCYDKVVFGFYMAIRYPSNTRRLSNNSHTILCVYIRITCHGWNEHKMITKNKNVCRVNVSRSDTVKPSENLCAKNRGTFVSRRIFASSDITRDSIVQSKGAKPYINWNNQVRPKQANCLMKNLQNGGIAVIILSHMKYRVCERKKCAWNVKS